MHPPSSLSTADIHRYMGKQKLATDKGSSRASKKKPNVPLAAVQQANPPSVDVGMIDIPSVGISNADAVITLAAPAST